MKSVLIMYCFICRSVRAIKVAEDEEVAAQKARWAAAGNGEVRPWPPAAVRFLHTKHYITRTRCI